MGVKIKDKKKHALNILDKVIEPYYIAASPIINVNIRQKKITVLLDSGVKVIIIIINLT
jgi:hypothetical protein